MVYGPNFVVRLVLNNANGHWACYRSPRSDDGRLPGSTIDIRTKRAQYGLIKEYSLNRIVDPYVIQATFFLKEAIFGSLGMGLVKGCLSSGSVHCRSSQKVGHDCPRASNRRKKENQLKESWTLVPTAYHTKTLED